MSEETGYSLTLQQRDGFEFEVQFDWEQVPPLTVDEPEPMGHRKGPNPSRLVGAAVGNCLSASLLFCLQKSRIEVLDINTQVQGTLRRNEKKRLRLGRIDVRITLDIKEEDRDRAGRCLGLFEDFCVVTASIRQAVDVGVTIVDPDEKLLLRSDTA